MNSLPPPLRTLLEASPQPSAIRLAGMWHGNAALLALLEHKAGSAEAVGASALWGDDAEAVEQAAATVRDGGPAPFLEIARTDAHGRLQRCLGLQLAPLGAPAAGDGNLLLVAHDATAAHRERQRLQITLDVVDAARMAGSARDAMRDVSRLLASHWRVQGAGFGRLTGDGRHAEVDGEWSEGLVSQAGHHALSGMPEATVLLTGGSLTLDDIGQAELSSALRAHLERQHIVSLAVVALPITRHQGVPCLFLHHDRPCHWTEDDLTLLGELLLRSSALFERLDAEAEARAAKERLDLIEADGTVGLFDWDLTTGQHHWSPGLWQMLGLDAAQLVPSNEAFGAAVHPEDRADAWGRLHEVLAGDDRLRHDYRILRPDGEVRHVSSEGLIARGANGQPIRVAGIIRDVTDRQRLKEAAARDAFKATLRDQLRVPIDPLDTMVTAARTLASHFGVSRVGYAELNSSGTAMINRRDLAQPEREMMVGEFPLVDYGAEVAAALQAGRSVAIDNVALDPRTVAVADAYHAHGIGAIISVPILKGGRLVATFDINDSLPRRWSADEIIACEVVADRTAAAAERARADRAVRENERLLRAIGDATTDLIYAKDLEGRLIYANEATLQLIGLDWARAQGFGPAEMEAIDPASAAHAANDAEVLKSGDVGVFEEPFTGADGIPRLFLSTKAPMRDKDGAIIGLAGVSHDVTELRRAEAAVRESEFRFRTLADNIPTLCWMAEPSGDIFWYNRKWYEYTGTTLEEMHGWGWEKVHDPDILPSVIARWQQSLADRTPFGMVFPLRGADGIFRPFLTRVAPVFDDSGELVRWFGTNTDISELQILRQTEALHDLILESATDVAILTTDRQGLITSWNQGAANLFGWPAADMVGRSVDPLLLSGEGGADAAVARATALAEGRWAHDGPLAADGGQSFWASMVLTPLRNPEGAAPGFLLIARDRSTERRQEEHRRLLVDELNHRVKNTLAIVQGTAHQTFRGIAGAEAALQTFDGRLAALASAHQILTRENWGSSDLTELVAALAMTHDPDGTHIRASGPAVRLDPQTAVTVTMILHELVTNARKYGALSVDGGRIDISWTREGNGVALDWAESGGPAVPSAPRRGFGSRMIERAFPSSGDNRVELAFDPAGVRCRMQLVERGQAPYLQPGRGLAA